MDITLALGPLANQSRFIVYRLVPKPGTWKQDKQPFDPYTGRLFEKDSGGALEPTHWLTVHEALLWAANYGPGHGVGIVLWEGSGLFCIDLDDCLQADGTWTPHAITTCARFPGAAVERSVSGRALHIFAHTAGPVRPHGVTCSPLKMEAYDKLRFIAITGDGWVGDITTDHTAAYDALLAEYFPPRPDSEASAEWTTEPVPQWSGPQDDAELVNRALRSHGAGVIFGGKASFVDLWTANADRLAEIYPSPSGQDFDHSKADLALANHLAFWTGNNCERMERLARASELYRDKWEREEYFHDWMILKACATQKEWYRDRSAPIVPSPASAEVAPPGHAVPSPPAAPIPPSSTDTIDGAPILKLAGFGPVPVPTMLVEVDTSGRVTLPGVNVPTPVVLNPGECPPAGSLATSTEQAMMFEGCVYVEDLNQVMMPSGVLLDSTRFDNRFPGITFITTADGTKPSRSAWEAFVQSEVTNFPKVRGLYFTPREAAGAIVIRDGMRFLNSWVPVEIARTPGDWQPFWEHLKKLLPNGNDAYILLCYLAAMVQHQGVKFMWCPFIQGVEGNGKSFLCEAVERCIGQKYTHHADATKLGGRFNAALYGKIFIRVDEVKIDHQRGAVWETLKTMITETALEIEPKGVDAVTREVCFNMILLSNHKNGIRKTENDRRLAPFFCAQQTKADLFRDGLVDNPEATRSTYFNKLWDWADAGGWAVINDFLLSFQIPAELNPAAACKRAPETASTLEAIQEGFGVAEQEVMEAIAQEYEGFRGGWVSSTSLDRLLAQIGKEAAVPRRSRRQLLHTLGYVTHPLLVNEGRTPVRMSDGSQPVLYMKKGHAALELDNALAISHAFQQAQKVK